MGTIDLSWSINKELDRYVSIYGTQGTVLVGWKESKYRQSSSAATGCRSATATTRSGAFRSQIDNFAASIRGDEILLITARGRPRLGARSSRPPTSRCAEPLDQPVSNGASATA